jgi:molecular chaperone Hsp33
MKKQDTLYIAISKDKQIHGYICSIPDTVRELQQRHSLSMVSSAVFARALTAGVLLGGNLKNKNDSLAIKWNCTGPVGSIYVESTYAGTVRGMVDDPALQPVEESITDGELVLEPYLGFGEIVVTRKTGDNRPPYYSVSPIESGEIANDISLYLRQSLQIDSALRLGLAITPANEISVCGGLLLQAYPGASDKSIQKMYDAFSAIDSFTNVLERKYDNNTIMQDILEEFDLEIIGSRPISFSCSCSSDSISSILKSLPQEDFIRFIRDDGTVSALCEYCSEEYVFSPESLEQIRQ